MPKLVEPDHPRDARGFLAWLSDIAEENGEPLPDLEAIFNAMHDHGLLSLVEMSGGSLAWRARPE